MHKKVYKKPVEYCARVECWKRKRKKKITSQHIDLKMLRSYCSVPLFCMVFNGFGIRGSSYYEMVENNKTWTERDKRTNKKVYVYRTIVKDFEFLSSFLKHHRAVMEFHLPMYWFEYFEHNRRVSIGSRQTNSQIRGEHYLIGLVTSDYISKSILSHSFSNIFQSILFDE